MAYQKGAECCRQLLRTITVIIWLLAAVSPAFANSDQFIAARVWPSSLYTRLSFESGGAANYRYFLLNNPLRLVIDIENYRTSLPLRQLSGKVKASDPFIAGIRVAQFNSQTLRIVVDLKQAIRADIFSLKPIANFQHRLVVDLYPKLNNEHDPLGVFLAQTPAVNVPYRSPPSPSVTPPFIVMIDPGHGGEDPGAHGLKNTREKDVVLKIAQRLKRLIDQQPHMSALMTRNDDHFVPLTARVLKARQQKAAVFVSIHADAFANRRARGASVFTLSTRGATSAAARLLAQSQNESDLIGGVSRSGDYYVDNTLLELMQTKTLHDSAQLGKAVLDQLQKINPLHKKRVERAGFAVLKAPEIPSILVETAFISHPEEERKLQTAHYQQQLAEAILVGIKIYKDKHFE